MPGAHGTWLKADTHKAPSSRSQAWCSRAGWELEGSSQGWRRSQRPQTQRGPWLQHLHPERGPGLPGRDWEESDCAKDELGKPGCGVPHPVMFQGGTWGHREQGSGGRRSRHVRSSEHQLRPAVHEAHTLQTYLPKPTDSDPDDQSLTP